MTDTAGFEAIVEHRTLRATLSTVLNDGLEVRHGLRLLRNVLQRSRAGALLGARRAFPRLKETLESTLLSFLELRRKHLLPVETFVFSLCNTKTTRGTWLHYGRKGQGVALGFVFQTKDLPTNDLSEWSLPVNMPLAFTKAASVPEYKALSRQSVRLVKVEYNLKNQKARLDKFLEFSSAESEELGLSGSEPSFLGLVGRRFNGFVLR